jgi:[lysine-biosynthesis-protein LysW]--L-2-aminoadipate ligase
VQRVFVVAGATTRANVGLADAFGRLGLAARLSAADDALEHAGKHDLVLGRLDVRPTVDGVEPGLWHLRLLERRGVPVLNRASALAAAHDKLVTAARLRRSGLPHPVTEELRSGSVPRLEPPLVLKPRFGSWGRDVYLCEDRRAVMLALAEVARRPWFAATGALAQELVPPVGFDLRVVVAGGEVVGAVRRIAAPGEWRTNVALGAARVPTEAPPEACALALAAAASIGADLVGVDLLPAPGGGWVVLELNGAVEFNVAYARDRNVFAGAAAALLSSAGVVASSAMQ